MTTAVAEIIREVEAAGGHLAANGNRLQISAPRPLPGRLVDGLRRSKADVLTFLSGGRVTWDAADWREWIAERSAILEYDGELPRAEADHRAYLHALIEWQNRHPLHADRSRCAGCGRAIDEAKTDWRPLGDGTTVHFGDAYGLRCFEAHGTKRREEAVAALAALGLVPPDGSGDGDRRRKIARTETGEDE
jgi:hypothetical protein